MKESNCVVCKIVTVIVSLGAINWGLTAFFQMDLVAKVLGPMTTASHVAYGVIGVAGVMKLISLFACCPCCKTDSCKK